MKSDQMKKERGLKAACDLHWISNPCQKFDFDLSVY